MIRTNESANPVRFLRKLKDSDRPIPSGLHAACRKGKAWDEFIFGVGLQDQQEMRDVERDLKARTIL